MGTQWPLDGIVQFVRAIRLIHTNFAHLNGKNAGPVREPALSFASVSVEMALLGRHR